MLLRWILPSLIAFSALAVDPPPPPRHVPPEQLCKALLRNLLFRRTLAWERANPRPELGPPGLLHLKDGRFFPLTRRDGARTIETEGTAKITSENIDSLFTHEYKPGHFGAKAVFSQGTLLPTGAQNTVFFWRTGRGNQGTEFHHRDALATLKRLEAEDAKREQVRLEAQLEMLDQIFQKNGMRDLLPSLAEPFYQTSKRMLEQKLAEAVRTERAARIYLEDGDRANAERNQSSFDPHDLLEHSGFQLTAVRKDGKLKIVALDLDSSITSAQLSKLRDDPEWANHPESVNTLEAMLNQSIATAHAAIAPELRAYKAIRVKNLRAFEAAGIKLKAPPGYRLEDLP